MNQYFQKFKEMEINNKLRLDLVETPKMTFVLTYEQPLFYMIKNAQDFNKFDELNFEISKLQLESTSLFKRFKKAKKNKRTGKSICLLEFSVLFMFGLRTFSPYINYGIQLYPSLGSNYSRTQNNESRHNVSALRVCFKIEYVMISSTRTLTY